MWKSQIRQQENSLYGNSLPLAKFGQWEWWSVPNPHKRWRRLPLLALSWSLSFLSLYIERMRDLKDIDNTFYCEHSPVHY